MLIRNLSLLLLATTSLALCHATVGSAQTPANGDDPVVTLLDQKVDALFQNLANATVTTEDALAEFLADSPLEKQAEAVKALAARAKKLDDDFGEFVSAERVAAKRIGKDLVLMKYLYKAKNHPVVWYFTYYRDFNNADAAETGAWTIIAVRFDTKLELLGL
jgi:hypothetical protein